MLIFNNIEQDILNKYFYNIRDTGSTEIQIILLSIRIRKLSKHLSKNFKDFSNKKGLSILISKKNKLLKYLKKNKNNYFNLIKDVSKIA